MTRGLLWLEYKQDRGERAYSYTELANCLMDLSEAYVNRIGETALDKPTMNATLDGTIAGAVNNKGFLKCQGTMGKGIAKAI